MRHFITLVRRLDVFRTFVVETPLTTAYLARPVNKSSSSNVIVETTPSIYVAYGVACDQQHPRPARVLKLPLTLKYSLMSTLYQITPHRPIIPIK